MASEYDDAALWDAHSLIHKALGEVLGREGPNHIAATMLTRAAWHLLKLEEPYTMMELWEGGE